MAWLASEMRTYGIKPEIEAFDLSHIFRAAAMHKAGEITDTPYVQFVMGVKNAMPVDREVFDFYVHTVKRLFGNDAPWCAAGIGANQIVLNDWAISSGGHARTGSRRQHPPRPHTLAPSNATLVNRAVDLCEKHERPVATWQQAREMLGLRNRLLTAGFFLSKILTADRPPPAPRRVSAPGFRQRKQSMR